MDEKSIENGHEGQKFLVVCLFWGGCHHPNIGVATFFSFFFFFFFEPGVKLDEKSIENGLEGQKFLVVYLFWGGCHHPNSNIYDIL